VYTYISRILSFRGNLSDSGIMVEGLELSVWGGGLRV